MEATTNDFGTRVNQDERMFQNFNVYHDSYHHLRDAHQVLMSYLDLSDSEQAKRWGKVSSDAYKEIQVALIRFAEFFSTHTGHPCRATIKQVVSRSQEFTASEVVTFCRSNPEGVLARFDSGKLTDNSDFTEIMLTHSRYFFSNDVTVHQDYRNPNNQEQTPRYRSAIVWPIRFTHEEGKSEVNPDTFGFLGLDTIKANAFVESQHVFLGAGFADSLWAVLRLWVLCQLARVHDHDFEKVI